MSSNDIHLLKLPSYCTDLLQPLDLAVLKPIKSVWYKVVENFTRRERRVLTKKDFPSLFAATVRNGYIKEYGIAGFRKAGIIPFNPNIISNKQLGPSLLLSVLPLHLPLLLLSLLQLLLLFLLLHLLPFLLLLHILLLLLLQFLLLLHLLLLPPVYHLNFFNKFAKTFPSPNFETNNTL